MSDSQKIRILYVEDDANLGFVVKQTLADEGYATTLCTDGEKAIRKFSSETFDLCILDIMLPKKDGFEVAEMIRKVNPQVPIIFLTAKSLPEDRIKGLKTGADDYITKPFLTEELLIRIENLLKRAGITGGSAKDVFEIGKYTFDFPNYVLRIGDHERRVTEREANLLRLLCLHPNQVVTREILLKSIWGKDDYFSGRSMDVFISKLRKYLAEDSSLKIQVMHGIGFKLCVPEN